MPARSRRILVAMLAAVLGAGSLVAVAPSASADTLAAPDHLVIAAVYGSNGGAYSNDWVELYNPTDHDIALGSIDGSTVTPNYYQCYRSISGTSCSTSVKLYGTVLAHHYFLIWNANAVPDDGTYPAGVTPDLDVALTTANASGQKGSNFGGYSTGGQILLLNAASAGAYTGTGDLASSAARSAGVVDAVTWTKYSSGTITQPGSAETSGATPVTGASAGTSNAFVTARTFSDGVPQDTDSNAADFAAVDAKGFGIHSQRSDRVAVAAVSDATISRGEAMPTIAVAGSKGVGALTYSATGLPDGVTIDPSTGVISGTPLDADALIAYAVTVTVADETPSEPDTASTSFTLTLSSALRVDPVADVSATTGTAIDPITVTAHGGTPAYAFSATGLPTGLAMDAATGVISGTPSAGIGRFAVHVSVHDSGAGAKQQSASTDLTIAALPSSAGPAQDDPLAGMRLNEVAAAGAASDRWVELDNTAAAVTGAAVQIVDGDGDAYTVPAQDIAADALVVVDGADLAAAGIDLAAGDILYLTETDGTLLDETTPGAAGSTSWARYPDGTGDFAVASVATKGAANAHPAALTSDHLVISEVNGDQSGVYGSNWFELYNPTDEPISLGTIDTSTTPATVTPHYYMCYSATTSQSCSSPYRLYGTVQPHHHFLVSMYNGSTTLPYLPAGVTADLDFSTTDASINPSQQASKNIGGYSTGGQMLLLDASVDTTGVYPTAANDTAVNDVAFGTAGHATWTPSASDYDLADPSVNPSPVVDAMGFSKLGGTANAHGAEGWTGTASCAADGSNAASCVHSAPVQDAAHWDERIMSHGLPQDTNDNAADFVLSQRAPISQSSEHTVITPIADTEISLNATMDPIHVEATTVYGAATYAATGLPGGITIDPATGVISGHPDAADAIADYTVTVTVGDAVAADATSATFTMTLSKVLRVDAIGDVAVARGSALGDIRITAHGGTPDYSYVVTGLPAGVLLNPTTGVITGTPTDALGRYTVHVSVTDSAAGADRATVTTDFAIVETPSAAGPSAGDPLAGLRLNEVEATGTPSRDWVELYNTGAAITGAAVTLESASGAVYDVPVQSIPAHAFVVIEGSALHAAGLDIAADDALYLAGTADSALLDETAFTAYAATSWARTTDGTGDFAVSGYATKGAANSGAPVIAPNDLITTEVDYDNNSTDYYEYSEVTNTTDHPIDFDAYGLSISKSGAVMTLHDPSDTSAASPVVDLVIPAHGTRVLWWVENQYFGVRTTAQFLANYGLPAATPVTLVFGFSSMGNSGGDHSYDLSITTADGTLVARSWVDTPCAANTYNGAAVCTATNGNYAEHYAVPTDRSNPDAAVWYNSLHAGGDDIDYALKAALSSPGAVDLEQLGYSRQVTLSDVGAHAVTLTSTADAALDLSGYVLRENSDGGSYVLPAGTTLAAGADLTITAAASGLSFGADDYATLLAPSGYAYTDGYGIVDTTGPFLHTLTYDASSGESPVIDPTTGLPLPPAGGLYRPAGVSAADGAVYVSNTGDNVLAMLDGGGNTIIAGTLEGYGDNGDEGLAANPDDSSKNATLYQPAGTALGTDGTIYIADSGDNVIRSITPDGIIHRFAGTGVAGGAGAQVTADSTRTSVNLWHPESVAVDSAGTLLIADTYDNRILAVTADGAISVVAGSGTAGYRGDGHAATQARLSQPAGVAVDAHDNLYIADSSNNVVRRVDAATGVITTVAGDYAADQQKNMCSGGFTGDGGPATSAQLDDPQSVAVDGAGTLFIADTFNSAIREVRADGTISTLVNTSGAPGAENTGVGGGGAFPAGTHLNTPYAVAIDPDTHALYIADTKNNKIAEVVNAAKGGTTAGPVESDEALAVSSDPTAASACAALANGPIVDETAPTVQGSPEVGGTVTADPGTWTPVADSYAYQWLRDGAPIEGATTASYAVTEADGGHALSVAVTASVQDYAPASATSAAVDVPVPGPSEFDATPTPTITGTVQVGHTVTAVVGAWSPMPTTIAYQWYLDGKPVPSATSSTFTLTASRVARRVSVAVTGSLEGYVTTTVASASSAPIKHGTITTHSVLVSGTATVGHALSATLWAPWKAGSTTVTSAHLTYRWYANGVLIPGAYKTTYTIGSAYVGKRITARVTGTSPGYTTATVTSAATAAVKAR